MEEMSRRKMLLTGGAAAAAGAGVLAWRNKNSPESTGKKSNAEPKPSGEDDLESSEDFLNVPKNPQPFEMGRLAGVKFSNLLSSYSIGEERAVEPTEQIDFRHQLASLWRKKLDHVQKTNPALYPGVLDAARTLFSSYDEGNLQKINIHQFRAEADSAIREVRGHADLEKITGISAFAKFEDSQIKLLHKFDEKINGAGLVAYALTELMPTRGRDAETGAELLDFLLHNAGREFVDRIPAVHDSRISVGPYQFTSDALLELGNQRHGASRIQHAILAKNQIPESVLALHGAEHHKAAYLFAIDNLAMAILRLGESRSEKMLAYFSQLPEEFVAEYVAAAHHLPVNARKSFEGFADELIKYNQLSADKKRHAKVPDFLNYCQTHGVGDYCGKTRSNLTALRNRRA
jgi:hypothetical protein